MTTTIGSNICTLRRAMGITQSELAEKLGVSVQAVSKWETGASSPDVSLFPMLAQFFGVSIDRLFGFSLPANENEIQKLLDEADASMDTYKEISIFEAGLKRFPNSARLKVALAFSLSMVNRISEDENERKNAVDRAVRLCKEVLSYSGSVKERDSAVDMLFRIYVDTEQLEKAEEALTQFSPEAYRTAELGKVRLASMKKDTKTMLQHAEHTLAETHWMLAHILEEVTVHLRATAEDCEQALFYHKLHRRVLELFDDGGDDFCATYKIFEAEAAANCCMCLGDKDGCLRELKRCADLAEKVDRVAKSEDFHLSKRNRYFTHLREEDDFQEEYMTGVFLDKLLGRYSGFLEGNAKYDALKKNNV